MKPINPDEEKNIPEERPAFTHSYDWVRLYGDDEDRKRWRAEDHRHTEWIIEREAQRFMREGFYTDIEEARKAAREAAWPWG
jgi:hypothetical protein